MKSDTQQNLESQTEKVVIALIVFIAPGHHLCVHGKYVFACAEL